MVKREADDASVIAAEDTCSAGLRDQLASHRLVLPGDRFRDAALAAPARSRSTPTVGVLRKLGRPMALALLDLHRTQPRRRGRAPFTVDQGAVLSHEPMFACDRDGTPETEVGRPRVDLGSQSLKGPCVTVTPAHPAPA